MFAMVGGWDSSKNQSFGAFTVGKVTEPASRSGHTGFLESGMLCSSGLLGYVINPSLASLQKPRKQEKPTGKGRGQVERKTRNAERL